MKKWFVYLTLIALIAGLIVIAWIWMARPSPVDAASAIQPIHEIVEKTAAKPDRPVEPVVAAGAGLVCVIFGICAVSPLIIEETSGMPGGARR